MVVRTRCYFHTGEKVYLFALQTLLERLMNTAQLLSQYLEYNVPNTDSSVIQWTELYAYSGCGFIRLDPSFRSRTLRPHTVPASLSYENGVLSFAGKQSQWATSLFLPPCRDETVTLRFDYSSSHSVGQLILGFVESNASRCRVACCLLV